LMRQKVVVSNYALDQEIIDIRFYHGADPIKPASLSISGRRTGKVAMVSTFRSE
jgi:hypothetical protein